MTEDSLRKSGQMANLTMAAEMIVRLLNMIPGYYMVRQMGPILHDEGQFSRAELRAALDYLAMSGYIAVRTVKEKAAVDVADAEPDALECKLTPKGRRLALGAESDPLVKP